MVGYSYDTYRSALAELMVYAVDDPDFVAILPSVIDYAEQRIYRELDLLDTVVRDTSSSLTPNNRNFTLPQPNGAIFVVVDRINAITPAGATPENGTRNPLVPVSADYLDVVYGTPSSNTGLPTKFAMLDQDSIIVGPVPDEAYTMEVVGTQRPAPLAEDNQQTFLSQYLPDLFIAASMVFASGFMRNFGAQADDPKMAASWEAQYQTLFKSALVEETRKKFWSNAWTSKSPSPTATPPRE